MNRFRANSDYADLDPNPLQLRCGDQVTVGARDQTWPGWIWAVDDQGHDGYVPEEILEGLESGRATVREAFDPTVLTVQRGDDLESLRRIHGWHWCRNDRGEEGWVAGYLLKPVD